MPLNVHPDIVSLRPYVPGKPIEELQRELGLARIIKLASNENPLGSSLKALAALSEGASTLHRYPDGGAFRLREALADRWKVTPDQVILGNGSDEILGLLARTFLAPGDEAIMADQTFVIYKMEVTAAHGKPVIVPLKEWRHDLQAMADAITDRTRLLFLCNPNNPTGTMVSASEVERLLSRVPASYRRGVRRSLFRVRQESAVSGLHGLCEARAECHCVADIFENLWPRRIANRIRRDNGRDHQFFEPSSPSLQRQQPGAARRSRRSWRRRTCGAEPVGE